MDIVHDYILIQELLYLMQELLYLMQLPTKSSLVPCVFWLFH